VADHRDGKVRLELPNGFQYRSFHPAGGSIPARHDGMAAFAGPRANVYHLVRNREINGPGNPLDAGRAYDPRARGGCVTTVVDRHGNVLDSHVSLNGPTCWTPDTPVRVRRRSWPGVGVRHRPVDRDPRPRITGFG
jgi:hypothetical protein